MMPLRGSLCSKQSYTERIKWVPSVSSCLHLEQNKGRTCHSWTPAGCEPWATDGISLCLYCTMPMLCLRASQLCKLKQTFSFIDSIWLIFLNLCMCVCCVLPSLPWQPQTNIAVEAVSRSKLSVSDFLANRSPAMATPTSHDALHHLTLLLLLYCMTLIFGFLPYLYS